jgi:hypothetical protein
VGIFVGRCPRHGEFELILLRREPVLPCPDCGRDCAPEPTAPAIRFRGDGFTTKTTQPKAQDVGTAKLKQNRY